MPSCVRLLEYHLNFLYWTVHVVGKRKIRRRSRAFFGKKDCFNLFHVVYVPYSKWFTPLRQREKGMERNILVTVKMAQIVFLLLQTQTILLTTMTNLSFLSNFLLFQTICAFSMLGHVDLKLCKIICISWRHFNFTPNIFPKNI